MNPASPQGFNRANEYRSGKADAIAVVYARLNDPNDNVRQAAVQVLGAISERGHAGAVAAVSGHLNDPNKDVRRYALEAIEATNLQKVSALEVDLDATRKAASLAQDERSFDTEVWA